MKGITILRPGTWNGIIYTKEAIQKTKLPKFASISLEFNPTKMVGTAVNFKKTKTMIKCDAAFEEDLDNIESYTLVPAIFVNYVVKGKKIYAEKCEIDRSSITTNPCDKKLKRLEKWKKLSKK